MNVSKIYLIKTKLIIKNENTQIKIVFYEID